MKSDDAAMLREIQKTTNTALKTIQTLSEYIHDANLSRELFGQSRVYEDIRNRAVDKLLIGGEEVYQDSVVEQAVLSGGIHMNTLLNTSTSHIAELLIRGKQKGVTNIWKSMNRHDTATVESVELAEELTAFEQSCMEHMRGYL